MVQVNFGQIPAAARTQAQRFLALRGDDAVWVAGPLAHAAMHVRPFDPAQFFELADSPSDGPLDFNRRGWLIALATLSERYPEISNVLWDTIAIMGLRPAPHVEEGIPNLGSLLLHYWPIADAGLHAAAKATAFWSDINHTLYHFSGYYAEHGCDCNHILRALPKGASFPAMPADRQPDIAREWWCHFMAELATIYVLGLPFALNEQLKTYEGTMLLAEA